MENQGETTDEKGANTDHQNRAAVDDDDEADDAGKIETGDGHIGVTIQKITDGRVKSPEGVPRSAGRRVRLGWLVGQMVAG